MFKFIVVIYMFLDLAHSIWMEDELKKYTRRTDNDK